MLTAERIAANGGKVAEDLEYVPIPSPAVMLIKKSWSANLKNAEGKPLVDHLSQ